MAVVWSAERGPYSPRSARATQQVRQRATSLCLLQARGDLLIRQVDRINNGLARLAEELLRAGPTANNESTRHSAHNTQRSLSFLGKSRYLR